MSSLPELESKYIKSRHLVCKGKTHVWAIVNMTSGDRLGIAYWYGAWRQYIFEPEPECLFNRECLVDVCEFLRQVNAHRKAERERERQSVAT